MVQWEQAWSPKIHTHLSAAKNLQTIVKGNVRLYSNYNKPRMDNSLFFVQLICILISEFAVSDQLVFFFQSVYVVRLRKYDALFNEQNHAILSVPNYCFFIYFSIFVPPSAFFLSLLRNYYLYYHAGI